MAEFDVSMPPLQSPQFERELNKEKTASEEAAFSLLKKEEALVKNKGETTLAIEASTEALIDDLKTYEAHISQNYTSEDRHVMTRIFRLLIKMVNVLQEVAIAQSDHLQLLTRYQQAYTELQTQIPLIMVDGKTPLATKDQEGKQDFSMARNFMNQKLQVWGDNVRALRGVPENDAKKIQGNVNTSNQAVNRMMDLFSVLVRQHQELVSVILR